MDDKTQKILNDANRSVIQYRGMYAKWCAMHGVGYNEMLVFYTIREFGYCTQKQICESYLLPRQTIHNVISKMRAEGILRMSKENCVGREKAFVLTEKGRSYAEPVTVGLLSAEEQAIKILGEEKLAEISRLVTEYNGALCKVIEGEV